MPVQDEVPKSRITLTYRTEINGAPATVDLPFRLMIPADLSLGTSKDSKLDLDERAPRNLNGSNLNDVIKDMGISMEMEIPNKINPEAAENLNVKLDIQSIDSFSPQEVARQVPQIQSLLLLKKLLEEMQSNIANKKELALLLKRLFSDQAALSKMKEELKAFSPTLPKSRVGLIDNKSAQQGE